MILNLAQGRSLDLRRPKMMGVLNVTPDSFSDGGHFAQLDAALAHANTMAEQGADIIDVGGESTRPGAEVVPAALEIQRVIPVVEALNKAGHLVSVDTSKPEVMRAAIDAGAHLINDVTALQSEGAMDVAAASDVGLCLMHMQGEPQTMQDNPSYDDVSAQVQAFLCQRADACMARGIDRQRLVLDPGFGFGKDFSQNCELFKGLEALYAKWPVLIGVSRKRMIETISGQNDPLERDACSAMVALLALQNGAKIIRSHNVGLTQQALRTLEFLS